MKRVNGKFSRDKGAQGEREFISLVDKLTGGAVQLQRNLTQCRDGGDDCVGHDNLSIEVKRRANAADSDVAKWWQQAVGNCTDGKQPVLAWRRDYQNWNVVVHVRDGFPVEDVRGCVTLSLHLFCHCLMRPQGLGAGYDL